MVPAIPANFTEDSIAVADGRVQLRKGGSGRPLLVLHGELGVPAWLESHALLARSRTVYVPSLPGFGSSTAVEWVMSVRDLAVWLNRYIRESALPVPIDVVAFSLGGWLAAELATLNSAIFRKLVLVAPAGVKPEEGEIWDYFLNPSRDAFTQSFFKAGECAEFAKYYGRDWTPAEGDLIETNREAAIRLIWRPYMHSVNLPQLLAAVDTPTLLVWGRQDAIIPISSCEVYRRGIAGAKVHVIDQCGHMPEIEKAEEFSKVVIEFLEG